MRQWFKINIAKPFNNELKTPACLTADRFHGLDGLRGLAILCVISSHAFLDRGFNYYCYALGMIGVQTFFVISGFLITSLLLKEKILKGGVSLKKFYIRRLLRLAPVAYLFLIVAAVLAYIFKLDLSVGAFLSAAIYVKNLPFVQGHDRLVGHFWTLAIEEQFYLIFPVLLIYKPNRYLVIIFLLIIIIPLLTYLGFNNISIFYTNRIIHIFTFLLINLFGKGTIAILIGSLASVLIFKQIIIIEKLKSTYLLSILIFIAVALFRIITVYNLLEVDFGIIVFSIGVAYAILLNIKGKNLFRKLLDSHLLIKIGMLSYSLYIWQALFTHFFIWDKWFKYSNSLWLNLPILFAVAYISYHFFEKKFLKIKTKFH